MHVPEIPALEVAQGRNMQAKLSMRLLQLCDLSEPLDSVVRVHSRWWQAERTILAHFALASAAAHLWPAGRTAFTMFTSLYDGNAVGLTPDLDLHVVIKLIELFDLELVDKDGAWHTPQDISRWTAAREMARPTVEAIFELAARADTVLLARAVTAWEKLCFIGKYASLVIAPCAIEPSKALECWRFARSSNLRTGAAFGTILRELVPDALRFGNPTVAPGALERFTEFYLFDVCFTDVQRTLDVLDLPLLEQAIEVLATTQSPHQQTSLIAALLSLPDPTLRATAHELLEQLVVEHINQVGMLDADLACSFSVLLEQLEFEA